VRVQSVLYRARAADVTRLVEGVAAAARVARRSGSASDVVLALGDSTPERCLSDAGATELATAARSGGLAELRYDPFGANLGHGCGHNRLRGGDHDDERGTAADGGGVLVLINPDAYPAPSVLRHLLDALEDPRLGIAEARQVPVDNPKAFDARTGATPWAAGCCIALRLPTFDEVGGFDPAFFLHGDDVDLSWRVRLAGRDIRLVPSALVFHDRRIHSSGYASPAPVAVHHMALAQLIRTEKAGRPGVADAMVAAMRSGGQESQASAASAFEVLRATGDGSLGRYPGAAEAYLPLSELRRF